MLPLYCTEKKHINPLNASASVLVVNINDFHKYVNNLIQFKTLLLTVTRDMNITLYR